MRTGNKLLLSFVALVVVLMFCSDIVLWANFKKGIFGDKESEMKPRKLNAIYLKPFKVLKLKGHHMFGIGASNETVPNILFDADSAKNQFIWSQEGDTLSIQLLTEDGITLYTPAINTILLSDGCNLRVYNQPATSPKLNIIMGDSCYAEFLSVKIRSLKITGGISSTVKLIDINGENKVDSFVLQLGKHSNFESEDVPYLYTNIKVDSINRLNITDRSLDALKEIK
jgi:hypothetical protein